MGPPKTVRTILQEAFDELVRENVDDLGMDPTEALQDPIQTLTLQGVDLSGIVTCVPGEISVKDNPVIESLDRLKLLDAGSKDGFGDKDFDKMVGLFDKLTELCSVKGSGDAAIATKNGGVELICSFCSKIQMGSKHALGFESNGSLDPWSMVMHEGFAKIGIARALTVSLHAGLSSPSLVSACIALKAVAVNDEICKSIAESGGIDALLQCIDNSGEQGNKTAARTCCSLLSKLAGSDSNKIAIVDKRGMDRLVKLSTRFSDDRSVLQEVTSIITVLSLRSPDNAACAIEVGAGELAIQAMQKFSAAQQMQRSCCLMIRNLGVRNLENRTLLLSNGTEKFIRKAKENHESCKDAATDALRDLGLDNYNSVHT